MERVSSWRSQILTITIIGHPKLKLYHLKLQTLEDEEIIKVQIITKFDTSWKGPNLEITNFDYHQDPTPSTETIPSQTSNA